LIRAGYRSKARASASFFVCPTNGSFRQTCFFRATPLFTCEACKERDTWACEHSQMGIVATSCPDLMNDEDFVQNVQGCKKNVAWNCSPPPSEATFDNISITPSLDGSKGGLWHGFITNGEIK
jgi:hypothetical protein